MPNCSHVSGNHSSVLTTSICAKAEEDAALKEIEKPTSKRMRLQPANLRPILLQERLGLPNKLGLPQRLGLQMPPSLHIISRPTHCRTLQMPPTAVHVLPGAGIRTLRAVALPHTDRLRTNRRAVATAEVLRRVRHRVLHPWDTAPVGDRQEVRRPAPRLVRRPGRPRPPRMIQAQAHRGHISLRICTASASLWL
jgi:hypothetical protein